MTQIMFIADYGIVTIPQFFYRAMLCIASHDKMVWLIKHYGNIPIETP